MWGRAIHLRAERGVADRIAPVDQPLLDLAVEALVRVLQPRLALIRNSMREASAMR
jgi:hypothetical protein